MRGTCRIHHTELPRGVDDPARGVKVDIGCRQEARVASSSVATLGAVVILGIARLTRR